MREAVTDALGECPVILHEEVWRPGVMLSTDDIVKAFCQKYGWHRWQLTSFELRPMLAEYCWELRSMVLEI